MEQKPRHSPACSKRAPLTCQREESEAAEDARQEGVERESSNQQHVRKLGARRVASGMRDRVSRRRAAAATRAAADAGTSRLKLAPPTCTPAVASAYTMKASSACVRRPDGPGGGRPGLRARAHSLRRCAARAAARAPPRTAASSPPPTPPLRTLTLAGVFLYSSAKVRRMEPISAIGEGRVGVRQLPKAPNRDHRAPVRARGWARGRLAMLIWVGRGLYVVLCLTRVKIPCAECRACVLLLCCLCVPNRSSCPPA